MKSSIKLSAFVITAAMVTGCATNSDIEKLQSQINSLKTQVSKASDDAASAKASAESANAAASEASAKAASAEMAANRAADYAQETNSKLDRMFKKSMMK